MRPKEPSMDVKSFLQSNVPKTLLSDPFSEYTRKLQDRLLLTSGTCLLWALGWAKINLDSSVTEIAQKASGAVLIALPTYFVIAYLLAARSDLLRFQYASLSSSTELNEILVEKHGAELAWLKILLAGKGSPRGNDELHEDVDHLVQLVDHWSRLRNARKYLELALPVGFWLTATCLGVARLVRS
jgi:hypothetical protein